jgi:hypothetical protein
MIGNDDDSTILAVALYVMVDGYFPFSFTFLSAHGVDGG